MTLHPLSLPKLMLAAAPRWRQITAGAVDVQRDVPMPGSAGRPGPYTGTYEQLWVDGRVSRATSFALEAVHSGLSAAFRSVGAGG